MSDWEKAYSAYRNQDWVPDEKSFEAAFAAGRESVRVDLLSESIYKTWSRGYAAGRVDIKAERDRSAKLVETLKALQNSTSHPTAIAFVGEALAEYEQASRGE